jgi:Zn-finger nucleic acid-binding protein
MDTSAVSPESQVRCRACQGAFLGATALDELLGPQGLTPAILRELASGIRPGTLACLACRHRLTPVSLRGRAVDLCVSCGGMWLDAGELQAVGLGRAENGQLARLHAPQWPAQVARMKALVKQGRIARTDPYERYVSLQTRLRFLGTTWLLSLAAGFFLELWPLALFVCLLAILPAWSRGVDFDPQQRRVTAWEGITRPLLKRSVVLHGGYTAVRIFSEMKQDLRARMRRLDAVELVGPQPFRLASDLHPSMSLGYAETLAAALNLPVQDESTDDGRPGPPLSYKRWQR